MVVKLKRLLERMASIPVVVSHHGGVVYCRRLVRML
jgi:hypothetical protein